MKSDDCSADNHGLRNADQVGQARKQPKAAIQAGEQQDRSVDGKNPRERVYRRCPVLVGNGQIEAQQE